MKTHRRLKTHRLLLAPAAPHPVLALLALLGLVGLTFWLLPQAVGCLWQQVHPTAQHDLGTGPRRAPALSYSVRQSTTHLANHRP